MPRHYGGIINARVPVYIVAALEEIATIKGVHVSDLVREALEAYCEGVEQHGADLSEAGKAAAQRAGEGAGD